MRIALCYDTKSDYGYTEEDLEYTDFVSLHTVSEIAEAIERCGHEISYLGNAHKLKSLLGEGTFPYDLIFNITEGFGSRNRESMVPCLAELYDIPCTASDVYGMAINLNKYHTKILVESLKIPTPRGIHFRKLDSMTLDSIRDIGYPIVLKPNSEGGSMGLSLVYNENDLIKQSKHLLENYSSDLLAEEYISGTEVTVPIIGNGNNARALGVITILNEDGSDIMLYDSKLKFEDNVINTLDFKYSDDIRRTLMEYSIKIHQFFGLRDYSRMDFRIRHDGSIYFLEINTMPSLSRDGSFEKCGEAMGMEYHEVIGMIIKAATERYKLESNNYSI